MAIQDTISSYSPKCASNIIEATSTINDLLQTNDGVKYVGEKFEYLPNSQCLINIKMVYIIIVNN